MAEAAKTIQGRPCPTCRKPYKAVGYWRHGRVRVKPDTIVYRCGCKPPFVSCETRGNFFAVNGRLINRKYGEGVL